MAYAPGIADYCKYTFFYKKFEIKTLNAFLSKQHFRKRCECLKKFYKTDCSHFLIYYFTQ